jgi:hypothetical protein
MPPTCFMALPAGAVTIVSVKAGAAQAYRKTLARAAYPRRGSSNKLTAAGLFDDYAKSLTGGD